MKKVIIYAYTKFNVGDDLLIQTLCLRYPEVQFMLYAPKGYKELLSENKNLHVYESSSWISKFLNLSGRIFSIRNLFERILASRCCACVLITGSLFIQTSQRWDDYVEYFRSKRVGKQPFFLLSANFGPYWDEGFRRDFGVLFSEYSDVCFRETYSMRLFSDLPNVRCAPDAVFCNTKINNIASLERASRKSVAISLINLEDRPRLRKYEYSYLSALRHLCCEFLTKGYEINIISFCESEGDNYAARKLIDQLPAIPNREDRVELLSYKNDLNTVLQRFEDAEFVIATRFHAMIVGWMLRKKVLPICYSGKMEHVLDDISYDGPVAKVWELDSEDVLTRLCDDITSPFPISSVQKDAERQFSKLDKFLSLER